MCSAFCCLFIRIRQSAWWAGSGWLCLHFVAQWAVLVGHVAMWCVAVSIYRRTSALHSLVELNAFHMWRGRVRCVWRLQRMHCWRCSWRPSFCRWLLTPFLWCEHSEITVLVTHRALRLSRCHANASRKAWQASARGNLAICSCRRYNFATPRSLSLDARTPWWSPPFWPVCRWLRPG